MPKLVLAKFCVDRVELGEFWNRINFCCFFSHYKYHISGGKLLCTCKNVVLKYILLFEFLFKQVLCTLISFKLKFDILKKLNYYVISKKRYSKIKSGTPKNLYSRPGAFRGPRSLLAPPLHTDI